LLIEGGIAFELYSFANSFIFNRTVSGQLGIAAEFWWNWIVLRVAQWAASARQVVSSKAARLPNY